MRILLQICVGRITLPGIRKNVKCAKGASRGRLVGAVNATDTEAVIKEQSVNVSFNINPLFDSVHAART